jgi:hypothetical protein
MSTRCSNCESPLTGPYCARCGQHAHESIQPLRALLHDVWHLLTHADARLLSTLFVLLTKPGRLTLEYFAGRRVRYVPPFRLFFVISLVLFALVALSTHLHPRGAKMAAERQTAPALSVSRDFGPCDTWDLGYSWLTGIAQDACRRHAADGGKSLERHFIASLSKMMFIFLPLIAGLMMLLYWKPRHFYVEHLVFFLHTHAAMYVALSLNTLLEIPGRYVPWIGSVSNTVGDLLWIYAVWYAYVAMWRFYRQSWRRTAVKFFVIGAAYVGLLTLTLAGTLIFNAVLA